MPCDDSKFAMKRFALSTLCCAGLLAALPTTPALAQAQNYPANERQSFVNSCAYDRGTTVRTICACTFEKIKARYSYQEYLTIRRQIQNGQRLPAPVLAMIDDCRDAQARS